MDVTDFEAERPRLTAIATRILGSGAEAAGLRLGDRGVGLLQAVGGT